MRKSRAAVSRDWGPTIARPVKYSHHSWKSKFYYCIHKRSPVYLTHHNSVTSFENSFAIFKYSSPIYVYSFQNIFFFDDHNNVCISHLHHVYRTDSRLHLSNIRNVGWKKNSRHASSTVPLSDDVKQRHALHSPRRIHCPVHWEKQNCSLFVKPDMPVWRLG